MVLLGRLGLGIGLVNVRHFVHGGRVRNVWHCVHGRRVPNACPKNKHVNKSTFTEA